MAGPSGMSGMGVPALGSEYLPRRAVAATLLRATLTSAALTLLYFVVPIRGRTSMSAIMLLVIGLAGLSALLTVQIRSIMQASLPTLRAIEVLSTGAPLFLLLFSMAYFLVSHHNPATFSEPLSRLDALYFTVTTFATVGFGDIAAQTPGARALVTFQMIGDLVVIGFGVRLLLSAVQVGISRRGRSDQEAATVDREPAPSGRSAARP